MATQPLGEGVWIASSEDDALRLLPRSMRGTDGGHANHSYVDVARPMFRDQRSTGRLKKSDDTPAQFLRFEL